VTRLSAEERLVLLLCRALVDDASRDEARAVLREALAWPIVVGHVMTQGVLPLFVRNLESFAGVPLEIQRELAGAQRLNAARNALLVRGLLELLPAFARSAIPAIPLKGPVLAESLHGDPTLRVCADLDLLVQAQDLPRAFDVLLAAGYEHGEERRAGRQELDLLLESNMEYAFRGQSAGLVYLLELHWDVAWRWRADRRAMDDLWAEARPLVFHGAPAYALSPEWQLLYLAVHAARHRWQALKWLVDIHELCATQPIDWALVDDKARCFGWRDLVAITLSACHQLLGTRIPPHWSLSRLPRWVRLFPAAPPASSVWGEALLPLRFVPGITGKLGYVGRLALRPTLAEHRLLRIPSGVSMLYRPLRLLRLGSKWGWPLAQAGLDRLKRARTE